MSDLQPDIVIPDRPTFKAAEVCELLKVQPYVLRTWENEFKELGVAKSAGAPRVYRRKDVELAVRIRQLVFGDGLTLAGARRRLESERPPEPESELDIAEVVEAPTEQVATSRKGLDVERERGCEACATTCARCSSSCPRRDRPIRLREPNRIPRR